jgi:type III secretion system YscQ/HrcQ family protein
VGQYTTRLGPLPSRRDFTALLARILGVPVHFELLSVAVATRAEAAERTTEMAACLSFAGSDDDVVEVWLDAALVGALCAAVVESEPPKTVLPRSATQAELGLLGAVAAQAAAGSQPTHFAHLRLARMRGGPGGRDGVVETAAPTAVVWIDCRLQVGVLWGRAAVAVPITYRAPRTRRPTKTDHAKAMERLSGITVTPRLESVRLAVPVAQASALGCGDVLLFAGLAAHDAAFRLRLGRGHFALQSLDGGNGCTWRICGGFMMNDFPRYDGTIEAPKDDEQHDDRATALMEEMEVELVVELGRVALSADGVLRLSPGAVIELDRAVEPTADLRGGGKLLGRGELVDVEGKLGFRITELFD